MPPLTRSPSRKRRPETAQRGFTLVEVAIASVFATASILLLLAYDSDRLHTQAAQAQGDVLNALNNAVNAYEVANFTALINNTPIPGYANPYSPAIAELNAGGYLTGNFSSSNIYGGTYVISLAVLPAGCVAPNCNVGGTVSLSAPILNTKGQADLIAAGAAMAEAGGDAGVSSQSSPGQISGPNGAWTVANPMGNVAGILAMRNGYLSSGFSAFLRRDGSLPMTGTLSLGGNNISNVNTVTATSGNIGTVNGTTGNITSVNSTTVTSSTVNGTTVNSNTVNSSSVNASNVNSTWVVSQNGSITSLQTSGINNAGTINTAAINSQTGQVSALYTGNISNSGTVSTGAVNSTGRIATSEYLQVAGYAPEGGGCYPNGLIGQDGSGGLLTCQSGVWGRFQTFEDISTTEGTVDWYCTQGDPTNPQGYNYSQWAITCGSRFCQKAYGYGFGLIVESPGTSSTLPFNSNPGGAVVVACSR